jgi:hypothetical protein
MRHGNHSWSSRSSWILLCAVCVAAFVFSVSSYVFLDDHFGRISPARQIARYGDLPFKDFLDPGFLMTEFSSAGLQLLLGDSLLGDVLLSSLFVATGTTLVAYLAWQVSRSYLASLLATLLTLLTFPRAYDFDKVLFYPAAVVLCWRHAESPSKNRLWTLAAGAVVSGLFRYDTGVFVLVSALATLAVAHAGNWMTLGRQVLRLAMAVGCLSLPVVGYLQWTAGLLNTVDQVTSYGQREVGGTRISTAPAISLTAPLTLAQLPPPSQTVVIRWRAAIDEETRRGAEARYTLVEGIPREEGNDTWRYRIQDPSASTLRSLLQDPLVQDTSGIAQDRLTPESWWMRAQRAIPPLRVRLFAGAWHVDNAEAFLYYLFHSLPFVAALALALKARSASVSRVEAANVAGLIALCIVLNVFILRYPLGARVGGMIGPSAILAVWLAYNVWHIQLMPARWLLRAATLATTALAAWSISLSANWEQRLTIDLLQPSRFVRMMRTVAKSPPDPDLIESRGFTALVEYVRACTRPSDRVLATFFAPELNFFAQRGFAAGLPFLSGGHWSETRFQERSLQFLESNPAVMVIHRPGDVSFSKTYPLLSKYLTEHYRNVGTTDFLGGQSDESFTVLARNDRVSTSVHASSSMPCFQ